MQILTPLLLLIPSTLAFALPEYNALLSSAIPTPSAPAPPLFSGPVPPPIPAPVSSSASPSASPLPDPNPKPSAGVFICADANWGGACEKKFIPLGSSPDVCTVLDGTASSIGPDQGFTCLFYTNAICTTLDSKGSDYIKLTHPGNANVGYTDKGNFNDKLLSVQCVKTAPKGCAGEIC